MIKVSGTKTITVIVGFYFVMFLNHLYACHESHFSGEELLVGTSFFGGHTGDNKISFGERKFPEVGWKHY